MAQRVAHVHAAMKERGLDTKRLRLCAICTVCSKAFLKEVRELNEHLTQEVAAAASGQ